MKLTESAGSHVNWIKRWCDDMQSSESYKDTNIPAQCIITRPSTSNRHVICDTWDERLNNKGPHTYTRYTLAISRLATTSVILGLAAVSESGDRLWAIYPYWHFLLPRHTQQAALRADSHCVASPCQSNTKRHIGIWASIYTLPLPWVELFCKHLRCMHLV